MNEQQITINRSRGLARQLFLSAFPTSAEWFDLAWETASAKEWDYVASPTVLPDALHVSDATNPVVKEMTREFAILFEAFMQKFPIAREALIERLEVTCKKHGKNPRSTQRLASMLRERLEPELEFVVWSGTKSESDISEKFIPAEKIQEYISKQDEFDIFVHGRTVKVKNCPGPLKLGRRNYRLLIMFLRYRGRSLPPTQSYLKAWGNEKTPRSDDTDDSILEGYLKFAVSKLRTELGRFLTEKEFSIPERQRDRESWYRCVGTCSFCIILNQGWADIFSVEAKNYL